MKTKIFTLKSIFLFAFIFVLIACSNDDEFVQYEKRVVVANRNSGSISFIEPAEDLSGTSKIVKTLVIPNSEPMYVVYVPKRDRIYVGDRAQSKVHIIDPDKLEVENSIDVGMGVFHMWADGLGYHLWVNNDQEKTVSIIDLSTNKVKKTLNLRVKPHDVFVDKRSVRAYITLLLDDKTVPDSVYVYSAKTFEKLGAKAVGKDPHLFHSPDVRKLFVPCQSGSLYVLNEKDLSEIAKIDINGVHGIFGSSRNKIVWVTNIENGELYAVDAENNAILPNNPKATSIQTPHNVVVNEEESLLFVTHSGKEANSVSVHALDKDGNFNSKNQLNTVTVDKNPFGLAFYQRRVIK